jgi:large subunit ribosomal protein L4e
MLVLPNSKDSKPIARAFRNIPGLDTAVVTRLNLLRLAPGGHLGRFVIWDSEAFKQLDKVFSNKMKKGLKVPRAKLTQASIMRIMKSAEVRKVLRKRKFNPVLRIKKNPLKNFGAMLKLNPYAAVPRRAEILRMRKIAAAKKTLELQRANKIPKPAEKKPKKERKVKKLSKNVLVLKNGKVEKVPRKVKKTPPAKKPKADKPKPKLKHVKAAKAAPKGILGDRMRKAQKKAVKKSKLYRQRKAFAKLLLA